MRSLSFKADSNLQISSFQPEVLLPWQYHWSLIVLTNFRPEENYLTSLKLATKFQNEFTGHFKWIINCTVFVVKAMENNNKKGIKTNQDYNKFLFFFTLFFTPQILQD